MDERQWLLSDKPDEMLAFIQPQASDRKLRLLACAFRRQLRWLDEHWGPGSGWYEMELDGEPFDHYHAIDDARGFLPDIGKSDLSPEKAALLLRQIFGNPFRPVHMFGTNGITAYEFKWEWLTPDVLSLTQACYDTRDASLFGPIWDLLETAGCDNVEIRRALMWEQRCPKCLDCRTVDIGNGALRRENQFTVFDCRDFGGCDNSGWLPIPGEPYYVRGFWPVDDILGKS